MNLKKFYLLPILIMVVAFVTNLSAQTANSQRSAKPPTKVETNSPKPKKPMYATCSSCGGSGKKSRYNAHKNQHERIKCTACSGSGRRKR